MSDVTETKQTKSSPANEYRLTKEEKQTLLDLNTIAANQKLQVYELNMQLEQAQATRDKAESMFQGALSMLANAHGLPGGQLSSDFTILKGAPKQ